MVNVAEIKENGYDLSINKYEEIHYDEPKIILNRIKKTRKRDSPRTRRTRNHDWRWLSSYVTIDLLH